MFLRMLYAVGEQTAEDMLATVKVPVLVVAGELDTFTPHHLSEQMAAALPHSELGIAAGATHVVPIERREWTRDLIISFAARRILPELTASR
jgi:pimeloyl-ACP methyl ester carboxylesterase